MSGPAFTVVIPTYRRPEYLRETLQGIVDQTFPDLEALVVSDGPTEADREVVESFGDPRLRWLSVEHRGFPAPARNLAMRQARGEFIALCDDDDVWEPTKLEMQHAALRKTPAALCFSNIVTMDSESRVLGPRRSSPRIYDRWPRLGYLALPGYYIAPSTVVIPKRVIDAVGVTDERPLLRGVDDTEWFVRIAYKTRQRFLRVPRALVRYRFDVSRPGIGLQSGVQQTESLLEAVKENAGMSARAYRRFMAVQWIVRARGVVRAEGEKRLVMELLNRADDASRTVEASLMRAMLSAQRLIGAMR